MSLNAIFVLLRDQLSSDRGPDCDYESALPGRICTPQHQAILARLGELDPIARKILSDRTIYHSQSIPFNVGKPVLCDLGEARAGTQKHSGDIMPGI